MRDPGSTAATCWRRVRLRLYGGRGWLQMTLVLAVLAGLGVSLAARLGGSASLPGAEPQAAVAGAQVQAVTLLLPDAQALSHPVTQAWLQVAREEGVPLQPMVSDEFLHRMANGQRLPAVVVPDKVHSVASDLLVGQLYRHVAEGGQLLLAFDAAVRHPQREVYLPGASRLSDLVGVRYALYEQLGQATTEVATVQASRAAADLLGLQPGKLDFALDPQNPKGPQGAWGELATYGYPALVYSHFRTAELAPPEGQPLPQVLMRASDGDAVLTLRRHGRGQVLWANLPLGYLKTRTDGYLLHRLLPFFAGQMQGWPLLSGAPEARGGLVLNLHVDSNADEIPMAALEREGWFETGPLSLHITAGPHAIRMDDRSGLDLPNNPRFVALLRRLQAQGHELGSHGGWIHNVFGDGVHEDNADTFRPWLELNHAAVGTVRGAPVQVYSAPMGNQPQWVTDWLRANDFKAFYSTADNGVGPTRAFEGGQPAPVTPLWTFPVSSFGRIAAPEELPLVQQDEQGYSDFITALMAWTAAQRQIRLAYFHPATAMGFRRALDDLAAQARRLSANGRFAFYRMRDLSDFLNRREQVRWQLLRLPDGQQGLHATLCCEDATLDGMAWLLPRRQAARPELLEGQARIEADAQHWIVTATGGTTLQLRWSTPS
jgi:hypothetical protein